MGETQPTVSTSAGVVAGTRARGVLSFKGIPYAAPPVGALRFAAPVPAPAWSGVRDATAYGPTPAKPPYPRPLDRLLPEPSIPGDDVLNLNVWTPSTEGALPVLVWIHGGAFVNGTGAIPGYDGSAFARDGVVCVTINYRLGADGFLLIDGAPANRGLLDQIAALRWVHDNIAAFGGDTDRVTIAGESAGAMSVTTLLSMPAADGLYRRAIAQSGAGHNVLSTATASRVAAALADSLGVAPTVDGFAAAPVDDFITAQAKLAGRIGRENDATKWGELTIDALPYEPCLDGTVLSTRPIDAIAAGRSTGIDVLIGSNDDEYTLFLVPRGIHRYVTDDVVHRVLRSFGADTDSAIASYRSSRETSSPGAVFMDIMRDAIFRVPAIRVAEARRPGSTHVYEFGWCTAQFDGELGATHSLELGFVFDNLTDPNGTPLTGPTPPQHVADDMHRAWVSFVRSGEPGWPPYGDERTVMRFDNESRVVANPDPALRAVWDGIR